MKKKDIRDLGDPIETGNVDILKVLPNYEIIWNRYIGNDGISNPISSSEYTEHDEKNKIRKTIWQKNYCIFRNLSILKKIEIELNDFENPKNLERDSDIKEGERLLKFEMQLLLAVQVIYNSIELLDLIDTEIRPKDTKPIKKNTKLTVQTSTENNKVDNKRFKNSDNYRTFINYRNQISHNIRIRYEKRNNTFLLPNFETFEKKTDEQLIWEDYILENPQNLMSVIQNYKSKISNDFNVLLSNEIDFFEKNSYPILNQLDWGVSGSRMGTPINSGSI